MKRKRVIIIGSGGFISSEVEKLLKKKKKKLCLISRKKIDLSKRIEVKKLRTIIRKDDLVLFIAAKAPAKNFQMYRQNIKMVNNFSKEMWNKEFNKLIYISSDAVYSDSKFKLSENSEKKPNNWHGLMHVQREKIFKKFFNKKKLLILRPTLVYGKNDPHNSYGPNKFYRESIKINQINIFGDGEELRDHIWIGDLSKLIYKMIFSNLNGEFNLVSGRLISFYNIAKIISRLHGSAIIKRKRKGKMPHNGYRPISNSKILKYFPKFKFNRIENIIKNY
jgi:UDP-glucose 4-epimerase